MVKGVFLIGCMQSGKSYESKQYVKNGYKELKFAQGIYDETENELMIDLLTDSDKELFKRSEIIIKLPETKEIKITGRKYLQNKGEYRRVKDKEYWMNRLRDKFWECVMNNHDFVVSDTRHINECELVFSLQNIYRNIDIKLIFTNYNPLLIDYEDKHESELFPQFLSKKGLKHLQQIDYKLFLELKEEFLCLK